MARARSAGGFTIAVEGLKGVESGFANVTKDTRKELVRGVATIGGRVKNNAKQRAPKLTGELAKSIKRKSTNKGLGQRIYSEDPNAVWQEFGTQKMPANPFMFPALEEERGRFAGEMRTAVSDGISGAGGGASEAEVAE